MPGPAYNPDTEVLAQGRDGSVRVVAKKDAGQIVASGGTVLTAEESQAAARQIARYEEAQSAGGQVRTAAGATVSGILSPFAALAGGTGQQAAAGLLSIGEENPDYAVNAERQMRFDAEANQGLQFLGSTIGSTATGFLAGAGVGAAGGRLAAALGAEAGAASTAGTGLGARILAAAPTAAPKAAAFLTENALGGIGAANEQAFLENRELAADEVAGAGLIGAGLGVGIGAAARGLGYGASKLGQKVVGALPEGGLSGLAEGQAFKAMAQGAPKVGALKRVATEADAKLIGRRLLDEGIPLNDPAAALSAIDSKLAERGAALNAIEKQAAGHVDSAWLYEKIQQQAEGLEAKAGTRSAQTLARGVRRELEPLFERIKSGETLDFEAIRQARTQLRDKALNFKGAERRAYQELGDSLTSTLEEAAAKADTAAGEGSTILSQWKDANKAYRELSTAKEAYSGKLAKEQSAKVFGFGDSQMGQNAAVMGGLLTGDPVTGALLGLGTAAARKTVREKGAGWIAQAAESLATRGEVPSVTKLLAVSSQARQQLGKFAVNQLVQKGARSAAESEPAGFGYGAFANYSNPKTVAGHYQEAANYLQGAEGDIEGMATRANQHLGGLAQEQPELATAAQMKMANAVNYLRETQPQPLPRSVLAVAAGNESSRLPPSFEQVRWLKRFRATVDPSVIYGEIARGHVNPETYETLSTLYPAYLASVQEGVLGSVNELATQGKTLPYSQRLALDNLFGGTGQVEPTRRFTVQDRLAQANAEAVEAATPPSGSRKAPQIAQFAETTSDRLMTT